MTSDPNATDIPILLLGRYRVDEVIGEGAFGRVVRAFDTRLKRLVAIKTLKRSLARDEPTHFHILEDRFIREAEAGSRTGSHPNLVTVYDLVTDSDSTSCLILEYVPGGTLAECISTRSALRTEDALRLTADTARRLQAAHDAGIVHRDIKPANIFLAADGRAQVGDFGVAQLDHLSGRTYATFGHPGTPLYMSPEQAGSMGYIRAETDQYSLGLVLFEMLTGQAFKRLRARASSERLTAFPDAVVALFRRMSAAHADDRYPTMTDLLTDIQRMERQSPPRNIPARVDPHDPVYQRHHDAVAAPATAADGRIVHTAPGPGSGPADQGDEASTAQPRAAAQTLDVATSTGATAPPITLHPSPHSGRPDGAMTRRAVLAGAGLLVLGGGTTGVILVASRTRGDQPLNASSGTTLPTTAYPTRPNQEAIAQSAATTPQATDPPRVVPTPAPSAILTRIPSPIPKVSPTPGMVMILRTLIGHTDRVFSVAFAADGKTLVSGAQDETVRLWRVEDGSVLQTLTGHTDLVASVALASNVGIIASASFDTTARLWSASDGALLRTLTGHTNWLRSIAFTPDGQTVVTGSDDKTIRVWKTADGSPIRTITGHTGLVSCIAVSPDGQTIASGSIDKTVRLWQIDNGLPMQTLIGHTDLVTSVAFSPDGKTLASSAATSASGDGDMTARLWNTRDSALLHTLIGHTDGVGSVAFSPDGTTLVTSSTDTTVRLWRVSDGALIATVRGPTDPTYSVIYSPDGRMFASGGSDNTITLWRVP